MGAFTPRELQALHNSVAQMFGLVLEHHNASFDMSAEDFLELFAPKENHKTLKTIRSIAQVYPVTSFDVDWFAPCLGNTIQPIHLAFAGSEIAAPANPTLQEDARVELKDKITRWVDRRVMIGFNFGLVDLVLMHLDRLCISQSQARFVWPSISGLINNNDPALLGLPSKFSMKAPKTIPSLTPPLRDALEQAAGIIAGASLLGAAPTPIQCEVTIDLKLKTRSKTNEIGTVMMK